MTHIYPPCYEFSRRDIARHKCIGCGVNVIKIGDYCMLSSEIWERKLGLGWSDNMCVACVESRIGRKLSRLDFICFPNVEGFGMSDVLINRLGYDDATRLAKEQRIKRRKAHKLAKRKAKRLAARALRPVTATKAKPWAVAGISRSSWYAKKKLAASATP